MSQAPTIEMHGVTSSNVAKIGYDEATKTLAVQFKSGGLYHHAGVPKAVYDGLMAADSKGSHYASHIKGKYAHSKQ